MTTSTAQLATTIRRRVLDLSYRAHVGHIGSCLSIADILAVTHGGGRFSFGQTGTAERDRFVLSKGHAGLALYVALEQTGLLDSAVVDSFGQAGSPLGVHPEAHLPGIDFSTGSLGHGLGMAVGAALAARIQRSSRAVVVVMSDAELDAGSTWEAVNFAGHHRIEHLVVVVDLNGQQALGATADIIDLEPFHVRWEVAGWEVREVDGHDHAALLEAVEPSDRPVVVAARTTFGHGVSFMERSLDWHYLPLTREQYEAALDEVGG